MSMGIPVLLLASIGLLLSNHKLRIIPFNLIGVMLASLALLRTETFLVHGSGSLACLWGPVAEPGRPHETERARIRCTVSFLVFPGFNYCPGLANPAGNIGHIF